MKTIVAGSRHVRDYEVVKRVLDKRRDSITLLRHGDCRGVDTLAKRWAEENGIPVESSPAEWDRFGLSAGPRRNLWMVCHADQLIAFWDGKSRGTGNVIKQAQKRNLKITIIPVSDAEAFEHSASTILLPA